MSVKSLATKSREFRCTECGVLLAKFDGTRLSIRRGDLQAMIDGEFHASLVCYRPRCRTLNVLQMNSSFKVKPGPSG